MIRVAGITANTQVNGPGNRVLLSLQGCTLACRGCFNPHTHPRAGGRLWKYAALRDELLSHQWPLNLTISGGEPLQQAFEVRNLLWMFMEHQLESVGMFTGFSPQEAARIEAWDNISAFLDFAVMGRYVQEHPLSSGLRSSQNQWLFLGKRGKYSLEDFDRPNDVEVHVQNGQQRITGFPTRELLEELCPPS